MTIASSAGAKFSVSSIPEGIWGTEKGYVECVDLGTIVSSVVSVSVIRDRLVGGGAKKLSSVLGRLVVAMLCAMLIVYARAQIRMRLIDRICV